MIAQEFNLNLIPQQAPVVVHVSQYDIGEGRLIAHLYEGDTPYTPQTGATATIQGTKPDRIGFQYDDVVLSGSTATANLTEQMCAVAGRTVVNLIIRESDNRTGTFNFVLDVQPAALADDAIISRSDGSILDIPDLVERAEQAAESVEEYAEESEAWARGTRGGQAVASTDPTYHNNSKYYSEQSGDYVEDAEAWANGTRDGTAVESSDPTYHKNSKYFAEQSDDSAEDAEAYAVGTRDGASVPPTDPTYRNNAKHYAEKAAEIVDTGDFVVAVDPTSINPPTAPYLRPSDVVNNLTSTDTDKPLSAYQGKVLKDAIDNFQPTGDYLETSDIVDNLNSTDASKVLSAKQGKVLKDAIDAIDTDIDMYSTAAKNAGAHNSLYRGKELTWPFTTEQWATIKNGTFDDFFLGDVVTIGGYEYLIGGFDTLLNTSLSAEELVTKHHILLVGKDSRGSLQMADTIPTGALYLSGTNFVTTEMPILNSELTAYVGDEHLLTFKQRHDLSASLKAFFLSVVQITGNKSPEWYNSDSGIHGSSSILYLYERQFPIFQLRPDLITTGKKYWLNGFLYTKTGGQTTGTRMYVCDEQGLISTYPVTNTFGYRLYFALCVND